MLQDLAFAARMLKRNLGFTLVAVLTLGLGIGANTAIFSVLDAVLLKPLPFEHPNRLVWVWGSFPRSNEAAISPSDFAEYREHNHFFDQLGALSVEEGASNLAAGNQVEHVKTMLVSWNLLDAIGVRPQIGRGFARADENATLPQVVILGHTIWQQRFGGDHEIIGKSLKLDGERVTVIGVLGTDIPLITTAQIFVPAPMLNPGMKVANARFLRLIGRMKNGATSNQAQADLGSIARQLAEGEPATHTDWTVRLESLADVKVGSVRSALWILLGAVGLVLLIACSNVANLLLARGAARQREVAIRAALGAGRMRIVRQLLTESVMLAMLGGVVAISLASWAVEGLKRFGPPDLPRLAEVHLDGTVLAFAALISILTGLVFGAAPALRSTRSYLQDGLREGSRGSSRVNAVGGALVVSEMALSLVLLIGAGLMLKSFWLLVHVNPGFQTAHVVTTQIQLPADGQHFVYQLIERTSALGGVEAAGAITELPLSGQMNDRSFRVEGRSYPPHQDDDANYRRVAGNYFRAMNIPLLQGRDFATFDTAKSKPVVMVNEPFARRYYPGQGALGQHLVIGGAAREITGIVGGVRHFSLQGQPPPEMYVPFAQAPTQQFLNLVVRASGDPVQLVSAIREQVTAIDPTEAAGEFHTMDEVRAASVAQPRFSTFLLGLFAIIALMLSAIGLYGVISYAVSQRTREIGIRMALGAKPQDILRLTLGQGIRMTALGLAIGLCAAFFVTRLLQSLLFGVTPHDTSSFVGVPVALTSVALLASWLPARRAARVDPLVSLREE
ncbi:MAG TPA: ABC transporter permease [Bryobacteraceae bacterium]|nr:ABC transporter permease [Bryobacteraceae bacterium]